MAPGQNVGYIRVSTDDQSTARQLAGVELDRVFEDKLSGKDTARPGLQDCLAYLREGDTLHVHSLDRLGRSLVDLERIVVELIDRGVLVKLHHPGLTFSSASDPMSTAYRQMLAVFAEMERGVARERQREGIAVAKKAGKHLGRARSLSPDQVAEIRARVAAGEQKQDLAREFGVGRSTLYRALATRGSSA